MNKEEYKQVITFTNGTVDNYAHISYVPSNVILSRVRPEGEMIIFTHNEFNSKKYHKLIQQFNYRYWI